ncbi:hypothetical protein BMS3Abin03_00623 [bacterium BMS3Abin03]|nr:hypothetical protein BMS3Abin03_00623 [bacterium BMS3Abin03]HDZ59055.1 DUF4835 family protein [Ignavibacteriales bacterium]
MKKLILLLLLFTTYNYSQELNCNVLVNYQNLPVNNRELLSDFKNVVMDYMNNTHFTDENWDGDKIECSLNIFFTGASSDVDYSAQIVVVSQRPIYQSTRNSPMLTINDGKWSFKYEVGQSMYANLDAFDPLTSLLDYYALIIIGFDMDTWAEFGGTPYFKKAYNIVNLASNSQNRNGWLASSSPYSRWGLVNDLLSEKYASFRSAIFDYHYGIDIFAKNKQVGQTKLVEPIDILYTIYKKEGLIKSVLVKVWFDAKYGEITDHLKDYPDKTIFTKLKKIDPSHTGRYDSAEP